MTKNQELPKTYEAKGIEESLYEKWESSGAFKPQPTANKKSKPFVISIPPPNATGTLHLGHATMLAIEDLMIRHHRLRGDETLWVPGTDHAAIATQNVVEKQIWTSDKKTRHDIGREKLLELIETFVKQSKNTIRNQVRRMGASVDWSRERYTLDPTLSKAVKMVFKIMYDDGLIYRGNRIVNWCIRCQTTLADDEIEYKQETVPFYHFKFGPFSIGTVRPETKLGDKYVVVHPDDKRFTKYHGLKQNIPWISGEVEMQVLPDKSADPKMGSGAMTITPQHSFLDFEIAQKHGLQIKENIIGLDGKLTSATGEFAGLPVREAREKFVEILKKKGLIEKIEENYEHNVSLCYRCSTPVEPLVSKQWFVAVNKPTKRLKGKTLREHASEVVTKGEINFVPDRFVKVYHHWMNNLHDWCISRQIWFGHQIPVYYCQSSIRNSQSVIRNPYCLEPIVSDIPITKCPHCKGGVNQDPDTLDTWFSSGLWTFSTLLNPKSKATDLTEWKTDSPDLQKYHPTSVLETGYDIIFFWVARMILLTTYTLNEVPFKTVYLHGLVRDKEGRKMSKSLGNGIDPVKMIDKYGADAVRLSLVIGTTPGNDMRLYEEKIAGYRNFVNKLWNISRYILTTTKETKNKPEPKTLADEWILNKFNNLKKEVTNHFDNYRYSPAGEALYEFTWSELADWYLEIAKIEGNKDAILRYILQELLILWHPFTPYVSEHIWQHMPEVKGMLIKATWPEHKNTAEKKSTKNFDLIQSVITNIRDLKQELGIQKDFAVSIQNKKYRHILEDNHAIITKLAKSQVDFTDDVPDNISAKRVLAETVIFTTVVSAPKNQERLNKERTELKKYINQLKDRLSNKEFLSRAPAKIVAEEEVRLKEAEEKLSQL